MAPKRKATNLEAKGTKKLAGDEKHPVASQPAQALPSKIAHPPVRNSPVLPVRAPTRVAGSALIASVLCAALRVGQIHSSRAVICRS